MSTYSDCPPEYEDIQEYSDELLPCYDSFWMEELNKKGSYINSKGILMNLELITSQNMIVPIRTGLIFIKDGIKRFVLIVLVGQITCISEKYHDIAAYLLEKHHKHISSNGYKKIINTATYRNSTSILKLIKSMGKI